MLPLPVDFLLLSPMLIHPLLFGLAPPCFFRLLRLPLLLMLLPLLLLETSLLFLSPLLFRGLLLRHTPLVLLLFTAQALPLQALTFLLVTTPAFHFLLLSGLFHRRGFGSDPRVRRFVSQFSTLLEFLLRGGHGKGFVVG